MSNIEILRECYAAFARGDMPAVFAGLDPEIVWDTPESLAGGGVYRGYEEVGGFFAGLPERWAELRVEPETYLDAGEHIVALGRHRGSGRATGLAVDAGFAHVWTMRDGRAIRFTEYLDSALIARAFGAELVAG